MWKYIAIFILLLLLVIYVVYVKSRKVTAEYLRNSPRAVYGDFRGNNVESLSGSRGEPDIWTVEKELDNYRLNIVL